MNGKDSMAWNKMTATNDGRDVRCIKAEHCPYLLLCRCVIVGPSWDVYNFHLLKMSWYTDFWGGEFMIGVVDITKMRVVIPSGSAWETWRILQISCRTYPIGLVVRTLFLYLLSLVHGNGTDLRTPLADILNLCPNNYQDCCSGLLLAMRPMSSANGDTHHFCTQLNRK